MKVARPLRTRYLAKRRDGYTATRRVEDGSVRQVNEFRPELEALRFRYRELLLDAQIEFAEAGADDNIVAAASKSAGRLGEGGGIEPECSQAHGVVAAARPDAISARHGKSCRTYQAP